MEQMRGIMKHRRLRIETNTSENRSERVRAVSESRADEITTARKKDGLKCGCSVIQTSGMPVVDSSQSCALMSRVQTIPEPTGKRSRGDLF